MSEKDELSEEDRRLWQDFVEKKEDPPKAQHRRQSPLHTHYSPHFQESLSSPVLHKNLARQFYKGQLPIEASLDLHGYTRHEAHKLLLGFIKENAWRKRCLKVISGKGQGILYDTVKKGCHHPEVAPFILSFCHARPKDGGRGAFYLLLRRARPP